jgi:hypothetical protein
LCRDAELRRPRGRSITATNFDGRGQSPRCLFFVAAKRTRFIKITNYLLFRYIHCATYARFISYTNTCPSITPRAVSPTFLGQRSDTFPPGRPQLALQPPPCSRSVKPSIVLESLPVPPFEVRPRLDDSSRRESRREGLLGRAPASLGWKFCGKLAPSGCHQHLFHPRILFLSPWKFSGHGRPQQAPRSPDTSAGAFCLSCYA